MTFVGKVRRFARLVEPKCRLYVILSAVLATILGFAEIAFAYALQAFLAHFSLINAVSGGWMLRPIADHPIASIVIIAVLIASLRFFVSLLPVLAMEHFQLDIRNTLAQRHIGGLVERPGATVAEVGNLFSNLLGKAGSFLFSVSQLASALVVQLVLLVGMLQVSPLLTFVLLGVAILFALPTLYIKGLPGRLSSSYYDKSKNMTMRFLKDIKNINFLRISGTNDQEVGFIKKSLAEMYKIQYQYTSLVTANQVVIFVMGVSLIVLIISLNVRYAIVENAMLISFIYMSSRLSNGVGTVTASLARVQHDWVYAEELALFDNQHRQHSVEAAEEDQDAHKIVVAERARLEAQGLVVGREQASLCRPVSLIIESGETLLLYGQSGAGKSTLLLTLLGMLKPIRGSVLWNGVSIERLRLESLRQHVGYAAAEPFLIEGPIRSSLTFGLGNTCVDTSEILRALDIAAATFVTDLPGGLDFVLSESGEGVSAGQKQRLAIARALLRNPQILILDEATANIDIETEQAIMNGIRREFPDLLVIMVSHRNSLRQYADQVLDFDTLRISSESDMCASGGK